MKTAHINQAKNRLEESSPTRWKTGWSWFRYTNPIRPCFCLCSVKLEYELFLGNCITCIICLVIWPVNMWTPGLFIARKRHIYCFKRCYQLLEFQEIDYSHNMKRRLYIKFVLTYLLGNWSVKIYSVVKRVQKLF